MLFGILNEFDLKYDMLADFLIRWKQRIASTIALVEREALDFWKCLCQEALAKRLKALWP